MVKIWLRRSKVVSRSGLRGRIFLFEELAEATQVEDMSRPFGNGLDLLPQVMDTDLQQLAGLLRRAIVALYGFGLMHVALPLVERAWLQPGGFVALDVITGADKVVVDNWHYGSPRIPELKMLIQERRFGFEDVHAEWPHIVAGRRPGR